MTLSSNLGFPRLGIGREWKKACENYWAGKISSDELHKTHRTLTDRHWRLQIDAGIDLIPVNDFAYYDHMLDMIELIGAIPPRFASISNPLHRYFAMARGFQKDGADITAMEMTKWFDTNYHYIVPEFYNSTKFILSSEKPFEEIESARKSGVKNAKPVLVGPITFLKLGKIMEGGASLRELLPGLLSVYEEILKRFKEMDVEWVQLDEPALAGDLSPQDSALFTHAYKRLAAIPSRPKIILTTYFGGLEENAGLALSAKCEALHLDLVRAPEQLDYIIKIIDDETILSLGLVDGRNIWKTDLHSAWKIMQNAVHRLGSSRIMIAPSCSLLHSPIDLAQEKSLPADLKEWLAFAVQKLNEVNILAKSLNNGIESVSKEFHLSQSITESRKHCIKTRNDEVRKRASALTPAMTARKSEFAVRRALQQELYKLPEIPSTTIGSFPQTKELRRLRSDYKKGLVSRQNYEKALEEEIIAALRFQEEIGLDVLVHGEFERNDMVEYFGEQLEGFAFTENGWVQSYGSRAVKPPVIYGDILRQHPMTVRWSGFAQKNSSRPIKGMLTGPVTMLKWSFVRNDQPLANTCRQLALAVRDEAADLEKAGVRFIQIDEPALREGMPLKKRYHRDYLKWAVESFRIASGGVEDATQIHTHMCYSEFNEIIDSIAELDADVISIEASRSRMELLNAFEQFNYPNDIGPGIYDIHSPRVPSVEEMANLLNAALRKIPRARLWANPDCGLKTRSWKETAESLRNMMEAVKQIRRES